MERLKQKVASSSSRVIASLQQAATGTFQPQQPVGVNFRPQDTTIASQGAEQVGSLLMADADATAHLTEEEREILLEVFKKEEQFQRDTIKQMASTSSSQDPQPQSLKSGNGKRNSLGQQQDKRATQRKSSTSHSPRYSRYSSSLVGSNQQSPSSPASTTTTAPTSSSSATYLASGRTSATPSSRPSSSVFAATPTTNCGQRQRQQQQQQQQQHNTSTDTRANSSCSTTTPSSCQTTSSAMDPLGQCRICRKFILSSEPCHLCSNCNQFICEDCASYSASDQHWMCSSCRRRTTKPAIPADTLRELGLNQNSSPVRRMTLRLNQIEHKTVPNKGSNESNTSSNSSSGCSSMSMSNASASVRPTTQQPATIVERAQISRRDSYAIRSSAADERNASSLHKQQQQQPGKQVCDTKAPSQQQRHSNQPEQRNWRASANTDHPAPIDMRYGAQKTLSQPIGQQQQQQQLLLQDKSSGTGNFHGSSSHLAGNQRTSGSQSRDIAQTPSYASTTGLNETPSERSAQSNAGPTRSSGGSGGGGSTSSAVDRFQRQQQARRASVAVPADKSLRGRVSGKQTRKQSSGFLLQSGQMSFNEPTSYIFEPATRESILLNRYQQQLHQHQQLMRPQTMITASSESSMADFGGTGSGTQSRRSSTASGGPSPMGAALIPIPPDQIHLRRLSDQSNLVRRSSIIADTIDAVQMARNRSHSNIDSVSYALYHQQPDFMRANDGTRYSDENLPGSYPADRRASYSFYSTNTVDQARRQSSSNQRQQQQQQQISSIITSYSQKQRRSSEELHTDSSSDISEDPQVNQTNIDFDANEQPTEYFAPPKALNQLGPLDYPGSSNQTGGASCFVDIVSQNAAGISIPSVSVSEFSSSQQRLNQMNGQLQQQQQHIPASNQFSGTHMDAIMTTPMQINVAIEQAIQQQKLRQDRTQQYLPAGDMLSAVVGGTGSAGSGGYSAPRRGSSGRLLPQIPGEQSRSLLDLPYTSSSANHRLGSNLSSMAQESVSQRVSTLDLPSAGSAAVRRASAPEGQNIKIVVDDIDSSLAGLRSNVCSGSSASMTNPMTFNAMSGIGGIEHHQQTNLRQSAFRKQGELYERLVLYRDDSLDLNTNMARGFGLQVMGGKLDCDEQLQASVVWILPGGPADKVGLRVGDKIIEWDGKCLVNMTYEQVADVIESSANIAELLVKPAHKLEIQPGASFVRSQRRLSQQTERDLKKIQQLSRQSTADHQQQQHPQRHGLGSMIDHRHSQHQHQLQQQQQHQQHQQHQQRQQNHWDQTHQLLGTSMHHQQQQAISAGNSPLRSGTGRKLPQIPGAHLAQADTLRAPANIADSSMIGLKLASSSTSQLEQQGLGTGHYTNNNGTQKQLGQIQPEQRAISMHNESNLAALATQPDQWYQLQQLGYNNQPQSFAAYDPHLIPQTGYINYNQSSLIANNQDEVLGLIGLQVNVDERVSQLEISVLSAINLNLNPSLDYYVRLRILPESNQFKACKTLPRSDLNWKETFLFQNFPIQRIHRMALEIGLWVNDEAPRLSIQLVQPVCEALIPIQSARERNTDFWPLRHPPTSPQTRRKSLNDLLETHKQQSDRSNGIQLSAGYQQSSNVPYQWSMPQPIDNQQQQQPHHQQQQHLPYQNYQEEAAFVRGRSASNRNLPDASKLKAQPRRASDEVAGSSSHRLSSRLSPAASRRSISVINVGDGLTGLNRPSSKVGSQSNLIKAQMRRDSNQGAQGSSGNSPVSKYGSPKGSSARLNEQPKPLQHPQQQQTLKLRRQNSGEGITPSGRRSSLVGIHNMIGYTSQKSSLSDASEQKPAAKMALTSAKKSQRGSLSAGAEIKQRVQQLQQQDNVQRVTSTSNSSQPSPTTTPTGRTGSGSRRGSTDHGGPPKLERKGSFAVMTLRKLKRTMSLNKGNDQDANDSNQASRRSSSTSAASETELGEDLGLTRRLMAHTGFVGRLKLSFLMTKGQLEIDVISAQGLKFDQDACLGVYVKMYLKGKNKSNKRKTRIVSPDESPLFKQMIKYDGWLVDNKSLEASVWQKQGGLRGKIPIGFTEIRLSELSLNQLQISWYNLRSMDMVDDSSVED